jgi:hypothetical protein
MPTYPVKVIASIQKALLFKSMGHNERYLQEQISVFSGE